MAKSHFYFYVFFFLGLIVALIAYQTLPEKYFLDASTIISNPDYFNGIIGSYPFTIWFYKVTGLRNLNFIIIAIIQYPILIYLFYKIGIPKDLHKVKFKNLIILTLFLMSAIYVSVPSKEFINFIYIYCIVYLVKNRTFGYFKTMLITSLLLLFFAFFFRQYYAIVVVIGLAMYLGGLIKFKSYKTASIVYGLVLLIGISLSYGLIKGKFISEETRAYVVNYQDSNTMIIPPIHPDTWYGETISILHGFFSVNIPLNGLKYLLSPQVIIFVFWQLVFFILLLKIYGRILKEGKQKNYELWLCYILFSYFIVQGVFEPDLGSALRHKASVFPIIYYLLNYEYFRKKI